jgi:hypothetical protein
MLSSRLPLKARDSNAELTGKSNTFAIRINCMEFISNFRKLSNSLPSFENVANAHKTRLLFETSDLLFET